MTLCEVSECADVHSPHPQPAPALSMGFLHNIVAPGGDSGVVPWSLAIEWAGNAVLEAEHEGTVFAGCEPGVWV